MSELRQIKTIAEKLHLTIPQYLDLLGRLEDLSTPELCSLQIQIANIIRKR